MAGSDARRGRSEEARLASLETGHEQLQEDLRSLARSQQAFASEIRTSIQELGTKLSENQKTPWGVIIGATGVMATIMIGIVTLGMSGYVRDIERGERGHNRLQQEFIEHIRNGHPHNVQAGVDVNKAAITKLDGEFRATVARLEELIRGTAMQLDDMLQREIKLTNATTQTGLDNLDRRLQGEIASWVAAVRDLIKRLQEHEGLSGHPTTLSKVQSLASLLERVQNWQEAHDQRVVGLNAAQWERIKALERAVYGDKKAMPVPGGALGSD